jgi:putative membrane protein
MIVIGAALGLFWEFAPPKLLEKWIGEEASRGFVSSTMRALVEGDGLAWPTIGLAALGLVVFLIFSRVFSIGWALVRLNGYRLTRSGDDLRAEYGLLTRVTATVPRRRIQSITIRQSLSHRLFGRAAIRVATAGGKDEHEQKISGQREWLAPIIPADAVPQLVAELLPGVDIANLPWCPVDPRAVRRAFVRRSLGAVVLGALALLVLGPAGWWLWPLLILRAAILAKLYVQHLSWAISNDVVAFREGIFGRITTIAPLVRIQVVEMLESPFDRRTVMARVRVDTAGGSTGHGVDVPYLPADVARGLYSTLSGAAAHTAFQW